MPRFDELAPDQKAVLQLLLKQGKSYDDIAGLLRLDRSSVRERALDALDALGADAPGSAQLAPERQDELADHLLLQQSASERRATRGFLEGSAPGRAWARTVASELRPIGGEALPDIPADPTEKAAAFDERDHARGGAQRSSRLGGVLVLLAVVAAVGLGLFLALHHKKRSDTTSPTDSTAVAPTAGATGTSGATGAVFPTQQINFVRPKGVSGKALGFGLVKPDNSLPVEVKGLAPYDYYAVWFWNSTKDAVSPGFLQYDRKTGAAVGAVPGIPPEVAKYRTMVITRQPSKSLAKPGPVVLQASQPLKR